MQTPFMYVAGIHFDALTDIAWSKDGLNIIATSKDGYCSLIDFAAGELGEPLDPDMLPTVVAKVSADESRGCVLYVLYARVRD
jgi:chromatin assembly factor 1 subunit B